MKRRLVAACTVATAACAALAPPAGAQEPHPRAVAALEEAKQAVTQPPALEPPAELTPVLIRVSQALPRLEGHDRKVANRILARPDDRRRDRYGDGFRAPEAAASPACDTNFCVHWVKRSKDAPKLLDANGTTDGDGVPDYVERVQATADESFDVENTDLDWIEPVPDGTRGGDDRTDIYLLELDGRYFGYASPDEGQGPITSKRAYLVLDNNYREFRSNELTALEALQVTLAHEYNHVIQFAYDSLEDVWMFEATATWMENEVYPSIDDYLRYVRAFARSSRVPLTGNDATGLKIYGAAVWNHYLAETQSPDLVREAWATSGAVTPAHFSVAAYDDVLGGSGNPFGDLGDTFIEFATTTAEWRSAPDEFPDAADHRDMKRTGKLQLGKARTIKLDHLADALLKVPAQLATDELELRVRAPDGTRSGLDLVGRRGIATSGEVESSPVVLDDGGSGATVLTGDEYARVTAVVVNADARVNGAGQYTRNEQRFRVKLVRTD